MDGLTVQIRRRRMTGKVNAEAWRGYSGLRSRLCTLDESQYDKLYDLLTPPDMQPGERTGGRMPEETERQWKKANAREWIEGLEDVHRMMMGMRAEGEIKVLEEFAYEQEGP